MSNQHRVFSQFTWAYGSLGQLSYMGRNKARRVCSVTLCALTGAHETTGGCLVNDFTKDGVEIYGRLSLHSQAT